MKKNYILIFLTTFLLMFISTAYAAFSSVVTISGDGMVEKDNIAPTCGGWYLRDSDLTVQEAYNQNKFKNPGTNATWTNKDQKLFIECTDNMAGDYGCINVTEITDSNNQKRYYKEVKEYSSSVKTDSNVVTVTLKDAYQNERTCSLPVGGSNPYLDKEEPEITITPTAYNKFTYSATDDVGVTGYMVTTTPVEPALDDSNWITDPVEILIDNNEAHTYYVWAKDGINIADKTVSTYLLTKEEGEGTTLTLKYNNSTGVELTTGYLLNGTNIYISASLNTGYNNLTITKNNVNISNPSTITVDGNTTIASEADFDGIYVTFDPTGGSVDPTRKGVVTGNIYGVLPTPEKEGYVFAGWSELPSGYTPLEYIESTGTQYIDTGAQIFNKTNHKIFIDFEPTSFYNYNSIWGSTADADTFEGWIYSNSNLASRYNSVRYGNDNSLTVNTRYKLNLTKNNTILNKEVNGVSYDSGNTVTTNSSNASLLLFLSGTDYGKYKLYDSKIYSENILIRDFKPCIEQSTGKAGLYDIVNGVFYGNSGTGNFIKGPKKYVTAASIVDKDENHSLYADWNVPDSLSKTFNYTGSYQTFIAPKTGLYKLETWGAQGGGTENNLGGNGAYASGIIELTEGEILYIYVGNYGYEPDNVTKPFNGGGAPDSTGTWEGSHSGKWSGGGASDIRYFVSEPSEKDLEWDSTRGLNSRIMVAAGGGGGNNGDGSTGGVGGTLIGGTTQDAKSGSYITFPTQTTGYAFGIGQSSGVYSTDGGADTGAGGGGYYGGFRGLSTNSGGSGGSSYISGYPGSIAITSETDRTPKSGCNVSDPSTECSYHFSNKIFINPLMIAGDQTMPSVSGSVETGHAGNGNAAITYVNEFTLTYDNNQGTGCVSKKGYKTLVWGELCTPTRDGYKFMEWNTERDGSGSTITENSSVLEDLTVYAIWSKSYTITFDSNEGTLIGTSPLYTVKGSDKLYSNTACTTSASVPKATYSSYALEGWYTEATGGTKVLKNNGAFTGTAVSGYTTSNSWDIDENKTLYAHYVDLWAENLFYDNTNTGVNCTDVQCMLDYLKGVYH